MSSLSLSALDPNVIAGVRDNLAHDFSRRIFKAIPEISECIDFEAEASRSTTEKKRFERASQLLYSRRSDVQTQTVAIIRRIFDEKLFRLIDIAGRGGRQSLEGLTLLADERLDEEIAISNCSRRLKEQCDHELWSLTKRLTTLIGVALPGDSHNPVYPQTFAQSLMEAIGSLETNADVRLVVFKTFGPALLEIVPAVFTEANNALKARGIEIEDGDYYGRPILAPDRQAIPEAVQHEIAAKVNLELASALKRILSDSNRAAPTASSIEDEAIRQRLLATTLQLPVYQDEQVGEPAWREGLRGIEADNEQAASALPTPTRILHDARLSLHEKLTRDEKVISDIITVVFDHLLVDPRMPLQLRPIVARLQIPVLELALNDRSLLTDVNHPVRKLLDLIAEFGLTLGLDDDDDSTVRSVENIVDGLVHIHREVPNAFQLAFDRLDTFYYHHEEASLQTDVDLRELEKHEAIAFATRQADREIALRLQNRILPVAIINFLKTAWRDVLARDYLRGGASGQPWRLGLATVDDVLRSLHPATDSVVRRRLVDFLPGSIQHLLNRPDTVSTHESFAADFFAELGRAHQLALVGNWSDIGGELFVASPEAMAISANIASPSATLAALGLACGDWIETRDAVGTRRWRLNWITSIQGTCVFKHYESASTCTMGCEELRERLASGAIQRVRGLGLADEVLNDAFKTVSRKARREVAIQKTAITGKLAGRGTSVASANDFAVFSGSATLPPFDSTLPIPNSDR